ncbi:MAG: glucose-1-phosphate adenylyltransferase subunit GlgD [Oscillospiraceae bacterium]|nr:glucose-1-phosphate adenylyltransferase subunit GlgD [Oscillospiraceae bacterium]MBQ5739766.1 glucose-1-phosphate adenylyltransferase subunit GlgD [Oscillospiraceae bacterium]
MNGLHAIVFSYEKEPELRELVQHRMPASVPFGGRYRVIDFLLSSLQNAGVTDVGVVLHGNYQSLLDHLGSGKTWDMSRKHGGLKLLPPFADNRIYQAAPFRGWMEALAGVRSYIDESIRQDYVILCDGDLIANLPVDEIFEAHVLSGADITAVCAPTAEKIENANYFDIDEDGAIREVYVAPNQPKGCRSLEVYVMSRELLLQLVDDCAARDKYSFSRDVLAASLGKLNMQSFLWGGYAAQLRSVKEYFDRSMELLSTEVREDLFRPGCPIQAKEDDEASSYFAPGSMVKNSVVADGCTIEGEVENCIVFSGVTVGKGASVKNCVLFKNVTVGENVELRCVIADKGVSISAGRTFIGHENYPVALSKGSAI